MSMNLCAGYVISKTKKSQETMILQEIDMMNRRLQKQRTDKR